MQEQSVPENILHLGLVCHNGGQVSAVYVAVISSYICVIGRCWSLLAVLAVLHKALLRYCNTTAMMLAKL